MEVFVFGDPRFLSGGQGAGTGNTTASYESRPSCIGDSVLHSTESCIHKASELASSAYSIPDLLAAQGETIYKGKGAYHHRTPANRFLVEDQWPSAGIELETIASKYSEAHHTALLKDLVSNWFHLERDGSLDLDHGGSYGYELVTVPLPPKIYRNPQVWVGLENILSPWLESFDHTCTGLHVHVGLNQFCAFDKIPLPNKSSRMYVGKVIALLIYYAVADASFIDRVCLRKPGRYCQTPCEGSLYAGTSRLAAGGMTGYDLIDLAIHKLILADGSFWKSCCSSACSSIAASDAEPFCQVSLAGTTSHGTEVNTEHKYTIEFRRAKGTLHALSIHRIVELMTLIVRYAGKCCKHPEDVVSKKEFYKFIYDNTTSTPLKKLVESISK